MASMGTGSGGVKEKPDALEFPTTHLYWLESRVLTTSWNVPYGKRESLARCLQATICLAREKLDQFDDSCRRFVDDCLPICFEKLLMSTEVMRWGREVQTGIQDMLLLLVELCAVRAHYLPIAIGLQQLLAQSLNPKVNYQQKNRLRTSNVKYE